MIRGKGGGSPRDEELIIYEHLLCSRHVIRCFIYVLSPTQVVLSSLYKEGIQSSERLGNSPEVTPVNDGAEM